MIKHLYYDEAKAFLVECYRVLKCGGVIRLVWPDMFLIANEYVEQIKKTEGNYNTLGIEKLSIISREVSSKFAGSFYEKLKDRAIKYGHRWMYDFISLSALLRECGFKGVEKREFRVGKAPDLDKLDNRPENSLHLEARKGAINGRACK